MGFGIEAGDGAVELAFLRDFKKHIVVGRDFLLRGGFARGVDPIKEPLFVGFDDVEAKGFFGFEVSVEGGFFYPEGIGDMLEAEAVEAELLEQAVGFADGLLFGTQLYYWMAPP